MVIDHILDLLEEFRCSFIHLMSLLVKLNNLSFEFGIYLLCLLVWNQKLCLLLAYLGDFNIVLIQLFKLSSELIKSGSVLVQHKAVIVDQLVRFFVLLSNDLSYLVNSLIESFLLLIHFEILNWLLSHTRWRAFEHLNILFGILSELCGLFKRHHLHHALNTGKAPFENDIIFLLTSCYILMDSS